MGRIDEAVFFLLDQAGTTALVRWRERTIRLVLDQLDGLPGLNGG
jgi:hypothetical protein